MKDSYVSILCVFATLIASAQSATCRRCWSVGDTECCGNSTIECPKSKCMTISEFCNVDGKENKAIRKTCGDISACDACLSLSTERGLNIRVSSECCTGDLSNDDLDYNINCESLDKENGYECPACYLKDTMDGCDDDGTVRCRGAETQCVEYAGKVQLSDGTIQAISLKGCIVQDGCKYGFAALIGTKELQQEVFICTEADPIEESSGDQG